MGAQPDELVGRLASLSGESDGDLEIVGGYFLVKAPDYQEAVGLSKTCPHLRYGGRIELREIHPMHG